MLRIKLEKKNNNNPTYYYKHLSNKIINSYIITVTSKLFVQFISLRNTIPLGSKIINYLLF